MKSLVCMSTLYVLCACWRVGQKRGRDTRCLLKTRCMVLQAATPQVQSHTVISSGYTGVNTLCWHPLAHSPPVQYTRYLLLSGFISSSLSLYYCDTRDIFLLQNTQEAFLISDSSILEWPAWSPLARRKEQKLLPIVTNASCNCVWHRDAIHSGACESCKEGWKKDWICDTLGSVRLLPMTIVRMWKKRSLLLK